MKKKGKNIKAKENLPQEIMRFIILIIVLEVVLSIVDPTIFAFKDALKIIISNGVIICVYLIYIIIYYFFCFITHPIHIKVDIVNKIHGKDSCVVHGNVTSRDDERTLIVTLEVIDTISIWKYIAHRLLENKRITLNIYDDMPLENAYITCFPKLPSPKELDFSNSGTIVDITNFIIQKLGNDIPHRCEYELIIAENIDNPILNNGNDYIKPNLKIDDKIIGLGWSLFIKLEILNEDNKHQVKLSK